MTPSQRRCTSVKSSNDPRAAAADWDHPGALRVLLARPTAATSRVAAAFALAMVMMGCGGCTPVYLLRSGYEEARILLSREPIADIVARPDTPPITRRKLELVLAVRRFAAERLGLEVGGAYGSFVEVPPGALLQVVSAAKRNRLDPYLWWFPIVGDVAYKGFFETSEAQEAAAALESEGYDTYVRGSAAFSTLGWFDDPVLSSWLRQRDTVIADLVIHELLHRTIYLPGETSFNESFATFVGLNGAIEFFAERDGPNAKTTVKARRSWERALHQSERWGTGVRHLRELYDTAAKENWSEAEILTRRRAVFAELGNPDRINNAVILAHYAYRERLARFAKVREAAGGDLRVAIQRVRKAIEGADDPFAALDAIVAAPPSDGAQRAAAGKGGARGHRDRRVQRVKTATGAGAVEAPR